MVLKGTTDKSKKTLRPPSANSKIEKKAIPAKESNSAKMPKAISVNKRGTTPQKTKKNSSRENSEIVKF